MKKIIISIFVTFYFSVSYSQTNKTKNSYLEVIKLQSNYKSNSGCLKLIKGKKAEEEYIEYENRQVWTLDEVSCYGCVATHSFKTESVPITKTRTIFVDGQRNTCSQTIYITGIVKFEDYSGTIYYEDRSIKLNPGEMTDEKVVIEPNYNLATATAGSTHYYKSKLPIDLSLIYKNNIESDNITEKVYAKKLSSNQLLVDSYTNSTDITVKKGDKISITASGEVAVGAWAGSSSPDGISGYESYSCQRDFRHGSLLVKIGNGEWQKAGSLKSFVAQTSGVLQFGVNDCDRDNNSGAFTVEYHISRAK